MNNIQKTSVLVKKILAEVPETRNDDNLLYYHVCREVNSMALGMSFGMVLMNMKTFHLPSFKSVERARRKLQREHPEWAASKTIEGFRVIEEAKYKSYGKS